MFRFVFSRPIPIDSLFKRYCLYDPDVLLELGERERQSDTSIEELADHFSLILHDLRMAGSWKRTNRQRLRRTEEALCSHTSRQFRQNLLLLDVGASDGITTVDAVCTLQRAFGEGVRAYAADLNHWLLRYRRGPVVEYRASDGEAIMVRVGRFGVRLARPRHSAPCPDRLAQSYLQCHRFRSTMRLDTAISLVNPLARDQPGLMIIELDCLRRDDNLVDRISAVRASNVLNLGYFRPGQICQAIGHLYAYLREGGCLVISRNADGSSGEIEDGSVWIKERGGFRWVEDFGAGSEIKTLVDDWQSERTIGQRATSATADGVC